MTKTLDQEVVETPAVQRSVDGLVAAVTRQATTFERLRCWYLARDAASERESSGDPEGAGVIRDLMKEIIEPSVPVGTRLAISEPKV